METKRTLDRDWLLCTDPNNIGEKEGFAVSIRADSLPCRVPGVVQEVFPTYEGVVWYYHRIEMLPETEETDILRLAFEAVDYACCVYLDGELVGSHEGAQDPFAIDVTGKVKKGSLLALRVVIPKETRQNAIDGMWLPAVPHCNKGGGEFPIGGTYNYGGIVGQVALEAVKAVRCEQVHVHGERLCGKTAVKLFLINDMVASMTAAITLSVTQGTEPSPRLTKVLHLSIPAGRSVTETTFVLPDPLDWDIETPNLYRLDVDVTSEVGAARICTKYGYRSFTIEKGFFMLNGRRIYLKSTHTGNQYPINGGGVPFPGTENIEYRDLYLLKACGFNCVRFIASQPTVKQLNYCDELGLMVYSETFASWYLCDSENTELYFNRTWDAALMRDYNHPSLVIWGLLNETFAGQAHEAAKAYLPRLRQFDDTRVVILSSGKFVRDFETGCFANPGACEWEKVWGDDGRVEPGKDGQIGDYHIYPRFPLSDDARWRCLRDYCKGTGPAFISELGIGSLLDVETIHLNYERFGALENAPDRRTVERIRAKYEEAFDRYGMKRGFARPVDFLRASERLNAASRREEFDVVRANPRFVGWNLTGALDHALCGEGPITWFREFKPEHFDVFADGWNDLRFCLFTSKGNVYAGDEIEVEVLLSSIDILPAGDYPVHVAIASESGAPIWEKDVTVSLPLLDEDGLASFVIPILKEKLTLDTKAGKYFLRAYLEKGGAPAGNEKSFYITEKPRETLDLTIGAVGLTREAIDFLSARGVSLTADLDAVDTVLVGAPFAQGIEWENSLRWCLDPSLSFHAPKAEQTKAAMERLGALARAGKTVIFADSFYLHNHDDDHTTDYLDPLGLNGIDIFLSPDWLYHKDCAVLPHAFTRGTKEGILDFTWFDGANPIDTIVYDGQGDCAIPFFYVGGPIWCKPYNEMLAGYILGAFEHGKGRYIFSALPLLQRSGAAPGADIVLLNLIRGT